MTSVGYLDVGVASSQQHRPYMEDEHEIKADAADGSWLVGVYDGHGGSLVSEFLKKHLLSEILRQKHSTPHHRMTFEALEQGFACTDAIMSHLHGGSTENVGSTACVASVSNDALWIAHCGDSRGVLYSPQGRPTVVTTDHKPDPRVNSSECNRLVESGGSYSKVGPIYRVMGDLAVSRSFGDERLKGNTGTPLVTSVPEIGLHRPMENGSILVLASDGLWDVLSTQQCGQAVAHIMEREKSPQKTAETLVKLASVRGTLDNITVVVLVMGR